MNFISLSIVGIFLVLFVVGSVYFGLYHRQLTQESSETVSLRRWQPAKVPTISPTPTDAPPSHAPAAWRDYASPHGYAIKYPRDMEVIEGGQYSDFQLKNPHLLVTFGTIALAENKSIVQYVTYGFCLGGEKPVRVEIVDGATMYRSQRLFSPSNACLNAVVPLSNQGMFVDIQGKAYDNDGITLFDRILSTFRLMP